MQEIQIQYKWIPAPTYDTSQNASKQISDTYLWNKRERSKECNEFKRKECGNRQSLFCFRESLWTQDDATFFSIQSAYS